MNQFRKMILSPVVALLISSSAFADNITYSLEKQSLKDAIEKISKKANKPYITNGAILDGKTANAIKDLNGTQNALDEVLKNSGLEAIIEDGAIIIKPVSSVKVLSNGTYVLDDVSVSGKSSKNGSAQSGYLVEDVKTLGVWGNLSLQDTPYSMSIVSSDFIENTITTNMAQVAKQTPVIQSNGNASYNGELGNSIRGFAISTALVDGIPIPSSNFGVGLKEVDRVEVISGLSGFLYGSGNVGGTINYALKYPKKESITEISIGNNGGENYYTSVDTSQNITDKLSVRVFGSYQDGDTAKDNNSNEEKLLGVSFAYKPTDNLDLGLYYSHRESHINGVTPLWVVTGKMPKAFDTSKSYTPTWSKNNIDSDKLELKANYNFTENIRLRTAYLYKNADRLAHWFINRYDANNGTFNREFGDMGKEVTTNHGAYAYLDGEFDTGSIHHTLTFGGSLGKAKVKSDDFIDTLDNNTYTNINDLMTWNVANSLTTGNYLNLKYNNKNVVLGDNITFNENWSALVGVNYATVDQWITGSGSYDESKLTPTLSLIYKPIEDLTTYVTYMESLEKGTVVKNSNDVNNGKVFKPRVSTQYEMGAKYSINQDLLLSTALFRIEKANSMTENLPNGMTKTSEDGEQINEGVEVLLTGKATDSLTLMGGVTYISPKVEKATNKAIEGKKTANRARVQAKMYAEYKLPVSPKIFLNGGVYHTGTQWRDAINSEKLDAYTTLDLGARYETKLDGLDTTFRIYATNITGEDYWAASNMLSETPRSVAFNVSVKF
ncbi:TonB-dependent siderophore receptor [Aliarcobacter faecis]|uniref:TonB-dependent siderophore receptor n=1 Tax=Aliarcobacter faecis TaxID=1564138 RepID=UPI000478F3A2|nr:TonB-dependent siderophore receptor [Aliarcobacter faecis]QKF72887.1 TonB-dependent siderophore receptor [Aliarcobacter faecis]